jgi:hypothetical protein
VGSGVDPMIAGAIIGFLLGLIWCYYKQITALANNRGLIGAGSDLVDAGQRFKDELFGQKL